MGSILKGFGGVVAALLVIALYLSLYIVDEREKALVLRFGQIQTVVTEPGLNLKVPFIDDIIKIEDRILILESDDKIVQVNDGRQYIVDTVTLYRIEDAQQFLETVQADLLGLQSRLENRLETQLKVVYGKRSFEAALSDQREAMRAEILSLLKEDAKEVGVNIVDVRIRRTDLRGDVLQSTYDRMRSEREAEAADLRAKGTERSLTIKAQADRAATIFVAEAQRDNEIIRGEADAERNGIFADAYGRDVEFFEFYRSMQAYETALQDTGTTLVLSPNSEFFQYFRSDNGGAHNETIAVDQ